MIDQINKFQMNIETKLHLNLLSLSMVGWIADKILTNSFLNSTEFKMPAT
jgi:hypothetical protein